MKKAELKKLSREQLLDVTVKQDKAIEKIRGYASGMTRDMFDTLDTETLIDCFVQSERIFRLNTAL